MVMTLWWCGDIYYVYLLNGNTFMLYDLHTKRWISRFYPESSAINCYAPFAASRVYVSVSSDYDLL